jgi:hypothetical protein
MSWAWIVLAVFAIGVALVVLLLAAGVLFLELLDPDPDDGD